MNACYVSEDSQALTHLIQVTRAQVFYAHVSLETEF